MLYISAVVALACSLAVVASPVEKRTVAQILADIAQFSSDLNDAHTALAALPSTGGFGVITQVQALITSATNLELFIGKGTADIQNTGALDEADASTILTRLVALEPTLTDSANLLIAKKAAFVFLPLGGTMITDLANLASSDFDVLTTTFLNAAPNDLAMNITALQTFAHTEFNAIIAAYS